MKHRSYNTRTFLISLVILITACSGGPAEKPALDALSSPANLLDQGVRHYNNNNYPKAIRDFEKSLQQYRSIDNQAGVASSCMNLAKTYMATNNNQTAAEYLSKANAIIKQENLLQLNEHLHLLKSSLAINNALYDNAIQELNAVLSSSKPSVKLAALKNRTRIAFIKNDTDKQLWLEKYRTQQNQSAQNTSSHLARILRFEAELSTDDNQKTALLTRSLAISQQLARRTAIAATLTQWANADLNKQRYAQAEDKYLRALFIRHQLADVKSSLIILQHLQTIYKATNNRKQALANRWIEKLSNSELNDWQNLFADFDPFPKQEKRL